MAKYFIKNFGYHITRKLNKVSNYDVYDLASITKIASTVPSLMHFQERDMFDLDASLESYLTLSDTSSKKRPHY